MKTLPPEALLTEAEAAAMCCVLVTRLGGSYPRILGIRLASGDSDEVFKWFIAAILLGAPVRADRAIAAYSALDAHFLLGPTELAAVSQATLAGLLTGAGVHAYARRVALTLHLVAESIADEYDNDINRLHFFAGDASDLMGRLGSLGSGLSRRAVGVFLREMCGVWEKVPQNLNSMALYAAHNLGFAGLQRSSAFADELRDLWEKAAQGERTFADFEAALMRLGENYCSMGRCVSCPMVKLCVGKVHA